MKSNTNHTNTYKSHFINKDYEKRGCEREDNYFYKQRDSEKVGRILLKDKTSRNKTFSLNRKSNKGIFGGKEIVMVNERITEHFV